MNALSYCVTIDEIIGKIESGACKKESALQVETIIHSAYYKIPRPLRMMLAKALTLSTI